MLHYKHLTSKERELVSMLIPYMLAIDCGDQSGRAALMVAASMTRTIVCKTILACAKTYSIIKWIINCCLYPSDYVILYALGC